MLQPQHGGKAVHHSRNFIVACLAMVSLLALAGCGHGGSQPPAAVSGPAGQANGPSLSAAAAPVAKDSQDLLHPVVCFETTAGKFTVRLDGEKTHNTVENFLKYVASKHYEGTIFHQIQKDCPRVVIGGSYTPNLQEKPNSNLPVYNEADKGLKNRRGTIAMARRPDVIDSATCMFFINLADNEALDHKDRTTEHYGFCAFGEVTEGLDVLDAMVQSAVHDTPKLPNTPVETIEIKSVRRLR